VAALAASVVVAVDGRTAGIFAEQARANRELVTLASGNYQLPVSAGRVQLFRKTSDSISHREKQREDYRQDHRHPHRLGCHCRSNLGKCG
jgi:hypothetical protein